MLVQHVIFLHIPKTAGQSVYAFLESLFGQTQISPARVNDHLSAMTIAEIRRHRVYSGHFDWALLDCLPEPKFVFTILRNPIERILSFYFFLRAQASSLPESELHLQRNKGLCAALQMHPDDFFASPDNPVRDFLDEHLDNFYGYFFAGRTSDARRRLIGLKDVGNPLADDRLVSMALDNLSLLDGVYDIACLDPLERDLRRLPGTLPCTTHLSQFNINEGDKADADQRMEQLRQLGATSITFDRLSWMTRVDGAIWSAMKSSGRI